MKQIILATLALLTLFAAIPSKAQDVIYTPYEKFDYHSNEYEVVGMTGKLLYIYRNTPDGPVLDAYNDSMNKVATIILDFFPTKIYQTKFISYPDKIIILYQGLESNKVVQYAALLDEKGRLKGKPIELGSAKTGIFGAMKNYFFSAVSEDKKKIFVYTLLNKGKAFELLGKWLDDSLIVRHKSEVSFRAEETVTTGELNINNNGTVFMATYTTIGAQNYTDQYWILSLAEGDNRLQVYPLELGDKFGASGYMKIDNLNSKVYFGGFYSNKKNGTNDGIIYAVLDPNNKKYETTKFIPFDQDLAANMGERHRGHEFANFLVKQIIVKNDGGFVLISEQQFITTRTSYMPGMGYYSTFYSPFSNSTMIREYHYNDVLALSYNKEGERQWMSLIPKEQYSQEDEGLFSSYLLLNSGGTLVVLYNDFNATHSRIELATLSPEGKTNFNYFTADSNDYPDWLPRAGKQVGARILVVPCLHKKQLCFAKVVF